VNGSFDVVVVGSGPAGSVAAKRKFQGAAIVA
jgi:flavin-dependent dehydrogenase